MYNRHGWRAAAALSVGWTGFSVLILLLRGPHCPRYTWVGYKGGLAIRKSRPEVEQGPQETKDEKDADAIRIEQAQDIENQQQMKIDEAGSAEDHKEEMEQ